MKLVGMNFTKREGASEWVLIFLIYAVLSLLVTRAWLGLFRLVMGFELQIGNSVWHIAHVLWGGLGMMIAILLMLSINGDRVRRLAAVIGGIGFGLFIDEVGKYLTRDNDYFFQPAVMIIYITFVALFLIYRYLERYNPKDCRAILFQAINDLEEIAENDFEEREREALLTKIDFLLKNTGGNMLKLAKCLKITTESMEYINNKTDNNMTRWWKRSRSFIYQQIFKKRIILTGLVAIAVGYSLYCLWETWYLFINFGERELFEVFYKNQDVFSKTHLYLLTIKVVGDGIVGLLFLAGLFWLWRKRRVRGLDFFQMGLLVNLLVTSVARFYFIQFAALWSVVASLVLWSGLEKLKQELGYLKAIGRKT